MNQYIPIMLRSALFHGLTPEDLEQLLQRHPPVCRRYHRKEYLLHAGETIERFGLVVEGSVTVMKEDFGPTGTFWQESSPVSCLPRATPSPPIRCLGLA